MSAHYLELFACGCVHRQCRCFVRDKTVTTLREKCPTCIRREDESRATPCE